MWRDFVPDVHVHSGPQSMNTCTVLVQEMVGQQTNPGGQQQPGEH